MHAGLVACSLAAVAAAALVAWLMPAGSRGVGHGPAGSGE